MNKPNILSDGSGMKMTGAFFYAERKKLNMENEKVLSKIKKLFALAGNNSSEQEAKSALLAAQRLMAEHGIAMGEVERTVSGVEAVISDHTEFLVRMPWWHRALARVLAPNFKCDYTIHSMRENGKLTGRAARFFGYPEDVEICKTVYRYAVRQAAWLADVYVREYKKRAGVSTATGVKNDFLDGFISGVRDKFREQVEKNGWGLIVVCDVAVTQATEKEAIGKIHGSKIRVSGSAEAKAAGYRNGKQFEPIKGEIK